MTSCVKPSGHVTDAWNRYQNAGRSYRRAVLIAIALFVCMCVSADAAQVIYVRPDGNDERSGQSPLQAVESIKRAVSIASDGATLILGPGSYDESISIAGPKSPKGLTVYADVNGKLAGTVGEVNVDGIECHDVPWLQVIGLSITGSIDVESVSHVVLRRCSVKKAKEAAISIRQCANTQIADCTVRLGSRDALVLQSVANVEVTGCTIAGNRGYGLKHLNGKRATISRTEFRKNQTAMQLSTPTAVRNCLIVDNGRGIVVGASHTLIEHATIAFNKGAAIDCREKREIGIANSIIAHNSAGTTNELRSRDDEIISPHLQRNLWYRNGRRSNKKEVPFGQIYADPRFVSAEQRDLRLGPNSPARDVGTYTSMMTDFGGSPRAVGELPDLGCWEARPKEANKFYVSSDGDNTRSGLKPSTAWATLSKAARVAGPGDTVYVEAGVYARATTIHQSGSAKEQVKFIGDTKGKYFKKKGPVVLQLDEGEETVLALSNAKHVSFAGFRFLSHRHHKSGFGVTLQHCESISFRDCEWMGGGTCLSLFDSSASVDNCTFTGAGKHGIALRMSSLEGKQCAVDDCEIGLFIDRDASATMEQSRCFNNRVVGVYASGSCWLNSCESSGNGNAGIVMYGIDSSQVNANSLTLLSNGNYGCTFANCMLMPEAAACESWNIQLNPCGVHVSSGMVSLDSPSISSASKNAIHVTDGTFHCRQGTLTCGNVGVLAEGTSVVTFRESILTGNGEGTALVASGQDAQLVNCVVKHFETGVSSTEWSSTRIINCTLANLSGIGINLQRGSMELLNTIMVGSPKSKGPPLNVASIASLNHSHNLFHGFAMPIEGTERDRTELTKNPLFVDYDEDDFRLSKGSPAINSGMEVAAYLTHDIDGNARPTHHAYEIGAYEYTKSSGSLRVLKWKEKR